MYKLENLEIKIQPSRTNFFLDFKEVWRYRELFYIFTWRDIKVRYKQTLLGITWVIFQPLVSMVVFTVFFGIIAKIPSGGIPYPLFVYSGLVFWVFFSTAFSQASNSLVANGNIIQKVYFPKIILPLSAIVTTSVDLIINITLLLLMSCYFRFIPSILSLLIIPFGYLVSALSAAGMGMFFSALYIKYRDVRHAVPFFIQMLMFLTPVIYGASFFKEQYRLFLAINPMSGVIESVRAVISGSTAIDGVFLGISFLSSLVIFIIGLFFFNATEKSFADVV